MINKAAYFSKKITSINSKFKKSLMTLIIMIKGNKKRKLHYSKLINEIEKQIDLNSIPSNDKKFIIMSGSRLNNNGIFCDIVSYIKWIRICELIGYEPVIDMCNISNQYLEDSKVGKENSWEYFFNQPHNNSLKQAYSSSNRIIVNHFDKPINAPLSIIKNWKNIAKEDITSNKKTIYKKIYHDNIIVNADTYKYIEDTWKSFGISKKSKVLGLLCRGTDYTTLKPYGHRIQPSIEMIVNKVNELLTTKRVDYIFLVTEDYDIWKELNNIFSDKLRYVNCTRVSMKTNKTTITQLFEEKGVNRKQKGLDYIASIYLLAKCDYLIAGVTNALIPLMLIKETDYEYEYIWNLGKYGIDD